ncbi:MAG: penicillin-binding protein [Campylobacterota bacterium]|nr:penicillin-binding protein [Campylobacterota bacterium]
MKILKRILLVIFVLVISIIAYGIYLFNNGDIDELINYKPKLTTQVFDKNNNLLANVFEDQHRVYANFEEIPPRLIEAMIAIEDTAFFEHKGLNFEAIIRAAYKVALAGKAVEGASTITQQLVKNVLLTREKTVLRKFKEAFLSIRVERELSKEMILERYLNEIYFGHGYYGIKTASRGYFKKEPHELTLKEIAVLCGLPRAPSFYDPTKHKEMSNARANTVLERMMHLGWINEKEYQNAIAQTPIVYDEPVSQNIAPYVVEAVMKELSSEFKDIKNGGYSVYTTIDSEAQKIANEALLYGYRIVTQRNKNILTDADMFDGNLSEADRNASNNYNVSKFNGAIVSIEQESGKIIAMSGGINYYKSPFNRAMRAKRQTGSSFKPFLYLAAFDLGYSPASPVADISRTYKFKVSEDEEKIWRPENYERNFVGLMSAREAVTHSRNLASINLLDDIGLNLIRERLSLYGFTNLSNDLSLALGTLTLTPMEMSEYMTIISNYGEKVKPYLVEKVQKANGETKFYKTSKRRVTTKEQAYLMIDVMKDVVERGTGKAAKPIGIETAGKTGTTNDNKDAWFCGFTPSTQTVIWFGNDDSTQIARGETGGRTAAPVFKFYYEKLLKARPEMIRHFVRPEGVREVQINGKKEIFTDISKPPMANKMIEPAKEELLF